MQDIVDLSFEYRDEFQRRPIAEKVISLLTSDIDVSPMVINGGWGTGKTEFCHKLIKLIRDTKETSTFKPIYIDAFSADHIDDPLLTLISAVLREFPKEKDDFIQKSLPAIKYGLKAITKAGVSWVFRQSAEDLESDFKAEMKGVSNTLIDKSIEALLNEHIESAKNMEALGFSLGELAKDNQIILFIDELDRCRPDFALSLLEVIKHVFNVDGVQILLISNIKQLQTSISHCYGMDMESAHRYLHKFVKFSFELSNSKKESNNNRIGNSSTYFQNLITNDNLFTNTQMRDPVVMDFIKELIETNNISLRETEKLKKYFAICQIVSKNKFLTVIGDGYLLLNCFGVFLSCFYPELILKKNHKDILDRMNLSFFPDIGSKYSFSSSEVIPMVFIFQYHLLQDELKNIPANRLAEIKKEVFNWFGNGNFNSIDAYKYLLKASSLLKLEDI